MKKIMMALVVCFLFVFATPVFASASSIKELDPYGEELLETYREDLKEQFTNEPFLSDEEKEIFTEGGYELYGNWIGEFNSLYCSINKFYFPVIYSWNNGYWFMYTTKRGHVLKEELTAQLGLGNTVGSLHYVHEDGIEIEGTESYSLIYFSEEGKVKLYQFGEVTEEYEIPKNSTYCGHSFWEGFIFHKDDKVYALPYNTEEALLIAEDVKFVILSDYKFTSDRSSQPLFLMNDGTLKTYVGIYDKNWDESGNKDSISPSNPSQLIEVTLEGGY